MSVTWFSEKTRKEQQMDQLVMLTRELGRRPTFKQVDEDPRLPSANSYAQDWGSYSEAAAEAESRVESGQGKIVSITKPEHDQAKIVSAEKLKQHQQQQATVPKRHEDNNAVLAQDCHIAAVRERARAQRAETDKKRTNYQLLKFRLMQLIGEAEQIGELSTLYRLVDYYQKNGQMPDQPD